MSRPHPGECEKHRLPHRWSCHRAFDEGELDLLPLLIDRGYFAEIGHMTSAHKVSPVRVVERLTGKRYKPEAVAA